MRKALIGFLLLLAALADPASAYPPAVPSQLLLTVRETAGVARTNEVVRSGVPLPRSLNVINPATLAIVNSAGALVPAEFRVLARWNAPLSSTTTPIQWLLVTFPATTTANGTSTYRLVIDGASGANPAPATPLTLTQSGDQVTVNTGAAVFRFNSSPSALFDQVTLANGTVVISGGAITSRVAAADHTHPTRRRLSIEHSGPLSAVVVVEGLYSMPNIGGGGLSSRRRYVFTAGSPTAIVRQSVNWEGRLCGNGDIVCNNVLDAVSVERIRDTLTLSLAAPLNITAIGNFNSPAVVGTATAGNTAHVRQLLRQNRTTPLSFNVTVPGAATENGIQATGALLAAGTSVATAAIALNHMHRFEPQALRLLPTGELAIDLADDRAWIATRQGLFATFAVSALSGAASRATLDSAVWAPLNRPLRAWPQPELFASSLAVDEFPVGPLPQSLAVYDTAVNGTLDRTLQVTDQLGTAGLMTFGVYPRNWGNPILTDEIDCGGSDPTPNETFDNTYWCSTWTDYHSTAATATVSVMRDGRVDRLDEIANPAALRMLHTQIFQCAPGAPDPYCGQAPAGYGGYRSDFNSSHQYWDNLFLYYWLTGDYTVVETLFPGVRQQRNYYCSRRPSAPCTNTDRPTDDFANLTGRVYAQFHNAFRFIGLASNDGSYLDDYRNGVARAVTQYYVEPLRDGIAYGFTAGTLAPLAGPGQYFSDQLWLASNYDFNLLHRIQIDTNDAPLGTPALAPSRVKAAWARSLVRFGSTVAGANGSVAGDWPNQFRYTWSGERIGGALTEIAAAGVGGDPFLYDTGKAFLTGTIVRSAQETNDTALLQMGRDLTTFSLNAATRTTLPLSKDSAEFLSRVATVVARLAMPGQGTSRRGDADGDNVVSVADVFYLINFLFANGPVPAGLGDANSNGTIDVADVFYLISFLFTNGPPPGP